MLAVSSPFTHLHDAVHLKNGGTARHVPLLGYNFIGGARMRLGSFLALGLLMVFDGTAAGQSKPTDSQSLEAIVGEIRQLRQELRTLVGTAQRAQILISRVQVQESLGACKNGLMTHGQDSLNYMPSKETWHSKPSEMRSC